VFNPVDSGSIATRSSVLPIRSSTGTKIVANMEVSPTNAVSYPVISASNKSTEWTQDEVLYIRLYYELLFAVASLAQAPLILQADITPHKRFQNFFSTLQAVTSNSDDCTVRSLGFFVAKIDELVAGVQWKIQRTVLDRVMHPSRIIPGVTITPTLLTEYRKVRCKIGLEKTVNEPEKEPELWKFLQEEAVKQYLDISPVVISGEKRKLSAPSRPAKRARTTASLEVPDPVVVAPPSHSDGSCNPISPPPDTQEIRKMPLPISQGVLSGTGLLVKFRGIAFNNKGTVVRRSGPGLTPAMSWNWIEPPTRDPTKTNDKPQPYFLARCSGITKANALCRKTLNLNTQAEADSWRCPVHRIGVVRSSATPPIQPTNTENSGSMSSKPEETPNISNNPLDEKGEDTPAVFLRKRAQDLLARLTVDVGPFPTLTVDRVAYDWMKKCNLTDEQIEAQYRRYLEDRE
jgi:hypothetical protein